MKVAKISVSNILGIEHLEVQLGGSLTIVEGQNATGKTSLLEALRAALGGGHDATLIRTGTESGEAVLLLDDGTEIRRRITEERSTATVKHPQYGPLKKPQSYLDKLVDSLSFNPVSFLLAPPQKQAEWLLELLPLDLDVTELQKVADISLDKAELSGPPLEVLDRVRRKVYDLRTGVNRVADEKKKTTQTLSSSLPEQSVDSCQKKLAKAEERAQDLTDDFSLKTSELTEALHHNLRQLSADAQARIDQIRAELAEAERVVRSEHEEARTKLDSITKPILQQAAAEVVQLREVVKQAERAKATQEMIERFNQERIAAEKESAKLTESLKAIDALRLRLIKSLPIRGLEVKEDAFYKDGIPFQHVNKAKQVGVVLQLAKLRAKELPLVVVDNLECLDSETFAAFEAAAVRSGLQLVVTRVSDGPLHIETKPEPANTALEEQPHGTGTAG